MSRVGLVPVCILEPTHSLEQSCVQSKRPVYKEAVLVFQSPEFWDTLSCCIITTVAATPFSSHPPTFSVKQPNSSTSSPAFIHLAHLGHHTVSNISFSL